MTKIDDLEPGNWVVITSVFHEVQELPPQQPRGPYMMMESYPQDPPESHWEWTNNHPLVNGRPLCIDSMGLPFLLLASFEGRVSLDIRKAKLQKVSQDYAQRYYAKDSTCRVDLPDGKSTFISQEEAIAKGLVEKPPPQRMGHCPYCGGNLKQKMVDLEWTLVCDNDDCGRTLQGAKL